MKTVLIAGCGYLGTTAGVLLDVLGHSVWGLRRDPNQLPDAIQPLALDLSQPVSDPLPAAEYVVYALSAGGRTDERYRSAYVDALDHLLGALDREALERLVFVSSTGVYETDDGTWVDEDTELEPEGFVARRLLEGEARVRALGDKGVVLRLGGIYGPGRTRLIESVLNGESDLPAGPPRYTNRIHRDDAALAIAHLLELDDPAPVYNGVDTDPAEQREVLTWLAERLDVPPPQAGGSSGPGPRGNKRVRGERLIESGFGFRYPSFREGYDALIEGLGESHWSAPRRDR